MVKLNISFKDHIKKYILDNGLFKTNHNSKYTLDQILDVIEYILITGASWRSLNLHVFKLVGVKWQSIYYHFKKFSDIKVFENVYKLLLNKYFKTNKSGKLKFLSIDTSFIKNECSSNAKFNGFYRKKRVSKLSLIVDSNGVALSAILAKGNAHDQKIFKNNLSEMFVKIKSNNDNNKHKRYLLADAIYNNKNMIEQVTQLNITPIIWHRKNSKRKFNKHQQKYIKRE